MRSLSNSKFKEVKFIGKFKKLVSSKKAQFLIITSFVIVSIFYLVSKWMEPYTIPDTSEVALLEEPFIFNNIKEKALVIVNNSKSCEDVVNNLNEYKNYVEDYAFKKLIIYFDYTINTPCFTASEDFPVLILFDLTLESQSIKVHSTFKDYWPHPSA